MSEPVGNAPRNLGDVPNNSHKKRDQRPEGNLPEKEPLEKVVEGRVVTRKAPWYKRFARGLVADDAQSIGDFVMNDVIMPAVRNLISDAVKGSTDRILYGSSSTGRRRFDGGGSSFRTRYDRMAESDPRRPLSRESRVMHNFDEIVLESRTEVNEVLTILEERIERFGAATVADLYDLVGETPTFADRNYGWTAIDGRAGTRQVRNGWLIELPRPELLR